MFACGTFCFVFAKHWKGNRLHCSTRDRERRRVTGTNYTLVLQEARAALHSGAARQGNKSLRETQPNMIHPSAPAFHLQTSRHPARGQEGKKKRHSFKWYTSALLYFIRKPLETPLEAEGGERAGKGQTRRDGTTFHVTFGLWWIKHERDVGFSYAIDFE